MGVVGQFLDALKCTRRSSEVELKVTEEPEGSANSAENSKLPSKPTEAQKAAAQELKEKGNALFKKQEYEEALDVYTQAAETNLWDASIWFNRSICNRKLQQWEDAANDAEVAIELEPENAKGYYNRALAFQALEQLDEATKVCMRGLKKQPQNKALQQLRTDLDKARAEAQIACPGAAAQLPSSQLPPCPSDAAATVEQVTEQVKKSGTLNGKYQWKGKAPTKKQRLEYRQALVDMFRSKYEELKQRAEEAKSKRSVLQTDQYEASQKQGLVLTGGHRPMDRPEHVDLPDAYMSPVGTISVEQLAEFGCNNKDGRYMLAIYGDIFDVSDRPDKYGPGGPYESLTGRDLSWGLFAGVDTVDYTNKFYDLFKAKDQGKDKLSGLCSWLAWYTVEYHGLIGKLEPWVNEETLPDPPLDEIEEACSIM